MSTNPPSVTIGPDDAVASEDLAGLTHRVESWNEVFRPRNVVEKFLADLAARSSWKIEQSDKIQAARTAHLERTAPQQERTMREAEVAKLGQELIGPAGLETIDAAHRRDKQHIPRLEVASRPPELLVLLLESTSEGCRWLIERWRELIGVFDERLSWGINDEHKAIRLLGMIPDDQDNAEIRMLCLARCAVSGESPPYMSGLTEGKIGRPLPSKEEGEVTLRAICDRAIDRLKKLEARRIEEETPREGRDESLRHSFDASDEGKELRRYQSSAQREMLKAIDMLKKLQKEPAKADEPIETTCRECAERHSGVADRSAGASRAADRQTADWAARATSAADLRTQHALRKVDAARHGSAARRGSHDPAAARRGSPDPAATAARRGSQVTVAALIAARLGSQTAAARRGSHDPAARRGSHDPAATADRRSPTSDNGLTPPDRQNDSPMTFEQFFAQPDPSERTHSQMPGQLKSVKISAGRWRDRESPRPRPPKE